MGDANEPHPLRKAFEGAVVRLSPDDVWVAFLRAACAHTGLCATADTDDVVVRVEGDPEGSTVVTGASDAFAAAAKGRSPLPRLQAALEACLALDFSTTGDAQRVARWGAVFTRPRRATREGVPEDTVRDVNVELEGTPEDWTALSRGAFRFLTDAMEDTWKLQLVPKLAVLSDVAAKRRASDDARAIAWLAPLLRPPQGATTDCDGASDTPLVFEDAGSNTTRRRLTCGLFFDEGARKVQTGWRLRDDVPELLSNFAPDDSDAVRAALTEYWSESSVDEWHSEDEQDEEDLEPGTICDGVDEPLTADEEYAVFLTTLNQVLGERHGLPPNSVSPAAFFASMRERLRLQKEKRRALVEVKQDGSQARVLATKSFVRRL